MSINYENSVDALEAFGTEVHVACRADNPARSEVRVFSQGRNSDVQVGRLTPRVALIRNADKTYDVGAHVDGWTPTAVSDYDRDVDDFSSDLGDTWVPF